MIVDISGNFQRDKHSKNKILRILEYQLWPFRIEPTAKFENKIQNVYEKIKNISDFGQLVSKDDFFSELAPDVHPEIYNRTKIDFFKYIKKKFFTARKYTFYYPLGEIKNLTSIEIGYGTSLTFDKLPNKVQKFFIEVWNGDYDYRPEHIANKKELITKRRKYVFLKLEISSIGTNKTQDYAWSIINESLHILRYVSDSDCGTLKPAFNENKGDFYQSIEVGNVITQIKNLSKNMTDEIKTLTSIFQKEIKNELEEKIADAITINGISTQIEYNAVRLMLLCSGLEILLLAERGNIGYKLAERVAFLVNKTGNNRMDVFNEINELYGKRSTYTHKGKQGVTEEDLKRLNYYFKSTVNRIVELRNQGYEKVADPNSKKSISYLADMIKFRNRMK